jgi:hypothetical protein
MFLAHVGALECQHWGHAESVVLEWAKPFVVVVLRVARDDLCGGRWDDFSTDWRICTLQTWFLFYFSRIWFKDGWEDFDNESGGVWRGVEDWNSLEIVRKHGRKKWKTFVEGHKKNDFHTM